jgi:hypothetical protein
LPVSHEYKALNPNSNRILIEAGKFFHSPIHPFTRTLTHSQCNFRSKYGAVIVSVHREGEHIRSKIGSIVLKVNFKREREGRRKKEEGRRKKEEGRRKKEEGRRKRGEREGGRKEGGRREGGREGRGGEK